LITFQHRLDGLDQRWTDAGSRNVVRYSNLGPGSYRLQVRALDGTGRTLPGPVTLSFVVEPFLWQQPWFIAGLLGALAFVIVAVHRVRVRRIEARYHAIVEERRRIARDLHDGMAQELAFIVRRARRLGAAGHSEDARVIAGAAERALGESRRAIAALTRPLDAPLADVLAEALEQGVARHPVELKLELERELAPDGDTREALVRIACEAVSNAARHADAAVVRVALRQNGGIRFSVADDGVGFDQSESAPGRFGLISMRERTVALGGSFSVRSAPGSGTEILVQLP
jgi:signal transduction histidine kinase